MIFLYGVMQVTFIPYLYLQGAFAYADYLFA